MLSGNSYAGVWISASSNNVVSADLIGLGANGTTAVANAQGVEILSGATGNIVGGTTVSARDVISANTGDGVRITGCGTNSNVVEGDYIGTNAAGGFGHVGNAAFGVSVDSGAANNTIGSTVYGVRDVISGNGASGVIVSGSGTTGNVVEGAYIGLDATGEIAVGNGVDGVDIAGGATSNTIGGTAYFARNVISGNALLGIWITGSGTSSNQVLGKLHRHRCARARLRRELAWAASRWTGVRRQTSSAVRAQMISMSSRTTPATASGLAPVPSVT